MCDCDLRDRQWNPHTNKCERCGASTGKEPQVESKAEIYDLQSRLAESEKKSEAKNDHPFVIGAKYLIRTVTMIQTGKLVRVTQQELVLTDAAWIADTGRFSDALKSGDFSEVEPFPTGDVIIGRGGLIDACQISKLPKEQK